MADISKITIPSGTYNVRDSRIEFPGTTDTYLRDDGNFETIEKIGAQVVDCETYLFIDKLS